MALVIAAFVSSHLLSTTVFLPFATAATLFVASALYKVASGAPGLPPLVWRLAALAGSTLTFALAAFGLFARFDPEATGYQLVERAAWLPDLGIHYFVGVDGISLMLVLMTTFLVPLVLLATWYDFVRVHFGERVGHRISYGSAVTAIDHTGDRVTVTTRDGQVTVADKVLVTVSVGVRRTAR